jgi:hypothetical protein
MISPEELHDTTHSGGFAAEFGAKLLQMRP